MKLEFEKSQLSKEYNLEFDRYHHRFLFFPIFLFPNENYDHLFQ